MGQPRRAEGQHFRDEDWYGEELGAARFSGCTFTEVDLSEATTKRADVETTA